MSWDFGAIFFENHRDGHTREIEACIISEKRKKGAPILLFDALLPDFAGVAFGAWRGVTICVSRSLPYHLTRALGAPTSDLADDLRRLSTELDILGCRAYTGAGDFLLTMFHAGDRVLDWSVQGDTPYLDHRSDKLPPAYGIAAQTSEEYFFEVLGRFLGTPFEHLPLDEIELTSYA